MYKEGKAKFLGKYAIVFVLIALVIFFSFTANNFFSINNTLNIARQVSMVGIAAAGMMFVLLVGGIDLSVGSQVTFTNIICAYMMVNMGMNMYLAILICIVMAIIAGLITGLFITKVKIPPFIATLAFMKILQGAAYLICGGLPIYGFTTEFKVIGQGYLAYIPIPVIIFAITFVLAWLLLYKTTYGRYYVAIGGNEEAAKLSGINVDVMKTSVYVLSSVFACIAGIVTLSRINTGSPNTGGGFEFDVIIACVLGGTSISGGSASVFGCLIGVFIMGVLANGMALANVSEYVQIVVQGVVLLLAVSFDCLQKLRMAKEK